LVIFAVLLTALVVFPLTFDCTVVLAFGVVFRALVAFLEALALTLAEVLVLIVAFAVTLAEELALMVAFAVTLTPPCE
jgi:hypothetical protein